MNPFNRTVTSERGAFLLELSLLTPVIVLLAFGGLALSSYLNERHALEFVARETAKAAFHHCAEVPAGRRSASKAYIEECLAKRVSLLHDFGRRSFKELAIVVSRFERVEAANGQRAVLRSAEVVFGSGRRPWGRVSKFDDGVAELALGEVLEEEGAVFVVEVLARRSDVGGLFQLSAYFPEDVYAIAII